MRAETPLSRILSAAPRAVPPTLHSHTSGMVGRGLARPVPAHRPEDYRGSQRSLEPASSPVAPRRSLLTPLRYGVPAHSQTWPAGLATGRLPVVPTIRCNLAAVVLDGSRTLDVKKPLKSAGGLDNRGNLPVPVLTGPGPHTLRAFDSRCCPDSITVIILRLPFAPCQASREHPCLAFMGQVPAAYRHQALAAMFQQDRRNTHTTATEGRAAYRHRPEAKQS